MAVEEVKKRKVVFYGRVSTEHEAQLSAFDNQMQWYEDLLRQHTNWELVRCYMDKGITGTQAKKRPAFMQMIADAEKGDFDLIVTREVCRFARNTVDALNYTRMLQRMGIEIFFVQDGIMTLANNEEIKLSLMATLAQEESRKISERVLAGQKVSREKGVLFGNGNILGYDLKRGATPAENTYVINEEQAETVRIIYDLCLKGYGELRIRKELEILGRKNAEGKVKWCCSKIGRILHNKTYAGYKCYNKSHTKHFLEQSREKNLDKDTYKYIKGDWEPIVSEEEWDRAQKILADKTKCFKTAKGKVKNIGKHTSSDIWARKLRCSCGSSFRKDTWHKYSDGRVTYGYGCYNQLNNGSFANRKKKGLDTEGYCSIKMIPAWKLDFMAKNILEAFWTDRRSAVEEAFQLIKDNYADNPEESRSKNISALKANIERCNNRLENLLEMRMDNEISKAQYSEMRGKVEAELREYESALKEAAEYKTDTDELDTKLAVIRQTLEQCIDFSGDTIDEEVLERLIIEVMPLKNNVFKWTLNLLDNSGNMSYNFVSSVFGRKNKSHYMGSLPNDDVSFISEKDLTNLQTSTGCYR